MNTQDQTPTPAPELPQGYRPVEYINPEALEVSGAMLASHEPASARMRKNMWALRSKVALSLAPIVRIEDEEGKLIGYAWNSTVPVPFDVKLERKLKSRSCRQLLKLRDRCAVRSARIEAKADKVRIPKIEAAMRQRAAELRNIGSAADSELRFERWSQTVFKNPDGN